MQRTGVGDLIVLLGGLVGVLGEPVLTLGHLVALTHAGVLGLPLAPLLTQL